MPNEEKLKNLIESGSFELSGSAMGGNLSGVDLEDIAGIAQFWFHGNNYKELAQFCAAEFNSVVVSRHPNHFQVLTTSSNLKKYQEKQK